MLALYRALSALSAPVVDAWLARRMAAGKEDAARFGERRGKPGRGRPDGPLLWVHAASVGESLSVLPLIERITAERPGLNVLVTTGTVTSAGLMARRLPARAFHQYVPVDRAAFVRRFLDHWRPDLALWVESEFWPNLLTAMRRRGIPAVLVNARLSPRSFRRWLWLKPLAGPLIAAFDLCLAQGEAEAARLRALGARRVAVPGNLKFAAGPLPVEEAGLERLSAALAGRPRWLAASTHAPEEEMAAAVHERLRDHHPGLLTIIAPRHPARGAAIAAVLRARGLTVARRTAGEDPGGAEVYLADTMGEMGLMFRLAPVAFIGGSLMPHGGHNPVEALRLGCAVVHGPHMTNFRDIADEMRAADAALEVADEAGLAVAVDALLGEPARARALAEGGRRVTEAKAAVLDEVLTALAPFLDRIAEREAARARA